MSQDKEREIRLQFLDEAEEYLDTLDSAILGISSDRIDVQKINAALRAAHSIKGGAAMMGFDLLSHLAHRLEDCFKVLKTQKDVDINAFLENLLLTAITCLRSLIQQYRRGRFPDFSWVDQEIEPVFRQLQDSLGEPQEEDAASVLATEDNQDILPVLFETEVEGCLQRLEDVLAHPDQPCLREELTILAQELGGLGEMLQLDAFSQLCASVVQFIDTTPGDISPIAQAALQAWRRTQALVLVGQMDALPTTLEEILPTSPSWLAEQPQQSWQEFEAAISPPEQMDLIPRAEEWTLLESQNLAIESEVDLVEFGDESAWNMQESWEAIAERMQVIESFVDSEPVDVESFSDSQPLDAESLVDDPPVEAQPPLETTLRLSNSQPTATPTQPVEVAPAANTKVLEVKPNLSTVIPSDDETVTVRVPIRQLNLLNDLFGELTIERNGLNLYLKRLRNLTDTLKQRVHLLERVNAQVRNAYDRGDFRFSRADLRSNGSPNEAAALVLSLASPFPALSFPPSSPLSNFQSHFDVLELDQYTDLHLLSQQIIETTVQIQEVNTDIELSLDEAEHTARAFSKTARQLQTNLTHIRMRPLSDVIDRFPRALRELCLQFGKNARLSIVGGATLVDRNILESLSDPLMHLLRNAFDHGIETPEIRRAQGKPAEGKIEIRAMHRGNRTLISISDDGRGIPLDKIRNRATQMGLDPSLLAAASDQDLLSLIFEPGFSTSDQVTALSGRGVGLDVVRDSLRQIRGEINVSTRPGVGTTFTLSVPFTLSVAKVQLVESNGMLLAIPTDAIEEVLLLNSVEIVTSVGAELLNCEGELVPFIRLAHWLSFNCPHHTHTLEMPPSINLPVVLMVSRGTKLVGIQVDRCWGEQEVAIRRVEGNLPLPPGFTGCAIAGDGRVIPLANVSELLDWITGQEQQHPSPSPLSPSLPPSTPSIPAPKPTILVVDDSINVRRYLALTLERAGYQVEQAKDGQDALEKLHQGLLVQAVICDVEMPRLDGYGFLAKVKADANLDQLPIAMLTSRSSEKHRQLASSLGASAYFTKPYNEQELLHTLEELVA
jgi:chemosensory pili system protein ChpA (sensor histidine kinase/response regulator)